MRFQFNINQLLNAKVSYKSLSNIEARALIYQKILLESEMIEKLKLLKILKNSFKKDNISNAFDIELKKLKLQNLIRFRILKGLCIIRIILKTSYLKFI